MVQKFTNFCEGLLPQGEVVEKRDYVRVTLLNMSLDDVVDLQGTEQGFPTGFVMGLPMALIDSKFGYQATQAAKVDVGRSKLLLGRDGVFLPGFSATHRKRYETYWVTEREVATGKINAGKTSLELDNKAKAELLRNGEAVFPGEKKNIAIRVQQAGLPAFTPDEPKPNLHFSQTNLNVFSTGRTGYELFIDHLRGLGSSMEDIINGFLADARAGDWHNDELKAWKTWIPQLPDDVYNDYLSRLKMDSAWPRLAAPPRFPSYLIAMVNVYHQTQTLLGYSRGRLLESVTLGPEETIEVEVFSWDRSITERSDEYSTKFESTTERERNFSTNVQMTSDMESSIGANVGGNLGVGLPIEAVQVDGGVEGGIDTEMRTRNENTIDLLSKATSKSSERFTATHQVKTLSRRETGTETRTTRTFKNPNLGRTLDVHHFEVVANYKVSTELEDKLRLALLVENEGLDVSDREWIRANHHYLDEVLLHDVYREGLEAAQVLAAQEWIDDLAAAEKRAEEAERQRLAESEEEDDDSAPSLPRVGIFDKALKMQEAFKELLRYNIHDAVDVIIRFHSLQMGITEQELSEADQIVSRVAWWTQFKLAYPAMTGLAPQFVTDIDQAKGMTDPTRQKELVISAVGSIVNNLDDDWLLGLKTFGAAVVLYELTLPVALNPVAYAYMMKLMYSPNDMGLQKLISRIRADYTQHEAKQTVEALSPPAPKADTLSPADRITSPPRAYSQKDLAQAHAAFGRLKVHLDAHEMYYRNEYFKREDPALRMQRLQSMGVAEFVENSLMGFAGTAAIYPLKVSALPPDTREKLEGLVKPKEDAGKTPVVPQEVEITMPTGGVTSEVSMGQCEALEPHLLQLRAIDLQMAQAQVKMVEAGLQNPVPGDNADSTDDAIHDEDDTVI